MENIVKGYKATDKNMQCRGFQFELGVWHKHDGEIAMCESGFHFCEYPSGPWAFYNNDGTRIFKVEAKGVIKGDGPGADLKHVAMEIRLVEEIIVTGGRNTGYGNTGYGNTGYGNTGYGNTGYGNTGNGNTGNGNTGDRNTGYGNTGNGNTGNGNTGGRNTGDRNTGDRNTGHGNTGNGNTGNGNTGDRHSGDLCYGEAPYYIFNKIANRNEVNFDLVRGLSALLSSDEPIDLEEFLSLPNASVESIRELHLAHITARGKI